jgi:hypothetical protein
MEKMQNVGLYIIGSEDQIAYNPSVWRRLDTKSIIQSQGAGGGMSGRTYPANALHNLLSIPGIPAAHDQFQSPEKSATGAGVYDCPVFNLYFHLQMSFYTSYGIYYDFLRH